MMDNKRTTNNFGLTVLLLSFSSTLFSGCSGMPERVPMNAELQEVATIPGIPNARSWADTKPDDLGASFTFSLANVSGDPVAAVKRVAAPDPQT